MFTDKNNPAKDIHELCQYLKIDGQNTPYIYRGQVDDYEGPLVPSMYRQHISRFDKFIEKGDPLFDPSSKKIGNKFYGDYVANFQKYKNKMFESSTNVSRELLYYVYHKALKGIELLFSQQTSRILLSRFTSRLDLIRAILSRDEMQLFDLHKDRWMLSINNYDRRMIRNFGFYKPLGYILGTALAQQYGFSSEGLDATKDIEVACFFATHSSKDYYKKILEEGIGVVYRFPYKEVYAAQDGG